MRLDRRFTPTISEGATDTTATCIRPAKPHLQWMHVNNKAASDGLAGLLRLEETPDQHMALQPRQMINEQYAIEMIDLVLNHR